MDDAAFEAEPRWVDRVLVLFARERFQQRTAARLALSRVSDPRIIGALQAFAKKAKAGPDRAYVEETITRIEANAKSAKGSAKGSAKPLVSRAKRS